MSKLKKMISCLMIMVILFLPFLPSANLFAAENNTVRTASDTHYFLLDDWFPEDNKWIYLNSFTDPAIDFEIIVSEKVVGSISAEKVPSQDLSHITAPGIPSGYYFSMDSDLNNADYYITVNYSTTQFPGNVKESGLKVYRKTLADRWELVANQNPPASSSIKFTTSELGVFGLFDDEVAPVNVTFPDSKLEAAVRSALNKSTGSITSTDMRRLNALYAQDSGIANLSGLEYASNLKELYLWDNNITSLLPLSGLLNLEILFLGGNNIINIAPLAALTKLITLQLSDNNIQDISTLSNLSSLEKLTMNDNRVKTLSSLSGLNKLIFLALNSNEIDNLIPLSGLTNLETLFLAQNAVDSIGPLTSLSSLHYLNLSNNSLNSIPNMSQLRHLKTLDLSVNFINSLDNLSALTTLNYLYLADNWIGNITPLAQLNNLSTLTLHSNLLTDITPLQNMSGLNYLYLGKNHLNTSEGTTARTVINNLQAAGVKVLYDNQTASAGYADSELEISFYFGDVTLNNIITVADAIAVLRHVVGLNNLHGLALMQAKVNGSSEVSVKDAIQILRYVVGLDDVFKANRISL